jgi:hypothetical protein
MAAAAIATPSALACLPSDIQLSDVPPAPAVPESIPDIERVRVLDTRGSARHLHIDVTPAEEPGVVWLSSALGPRRSVETDHGVAVVRLSHAERRAVDVGRAIAFSFEVSHREQPGHRGYQTVVVGTQSGGLGSDHLLFAFLGLSLFGVAWLYRREPEPEHRLRLAGAAGLIAVLFLCTAPTLPWTESQPIGDSFRDHCMLGHEAACIAPQGFAGELDAAELTLDQARWSAAAIRAGHVATILLMLPACIWLLVAPRSRGAQALVLVGALPALFTGLSTIMHFWVIAEWRSGGAADLTLLASSALVAVAAAAGLLGRRLRAAEPIPVAQLRPPASGT